MIVTGATDNSRLAELRKYTVTTGFTEQYVGGGSWSTDGVDYLNSVSGVSVVYYIGGIRYVDGIPVPIPPTTPLAVTTGTALPALVKTDSIWVFDNVVTGDGGGTVTEYGILYTQNASYGTDSKLVYNANPAYVVKKERSSPLILNSPYSATASPLNPDTLTYIRAYVKTHIDVAYGLIIEQKTDTINYYSISLSIDGDGSVDIDPPQPVGGYLEGTSVDLEAIPDGGWDFAEWIINGTHYGWEEQEKTIVMNSNKNVTAVFDTF
jgi:hypothetical protein